MSVSNETLEKIPLAVAEYKKAAGGLLSILTVEQVADIAEELLRLRKAAPAPSAAPGGPA